MWKNISKSLEPYQYTIWNEFTPLSIKHNAINLGQGFPGFSCPDFVKQAIIDSVNSDENQYSRAQGYEPLVEEIARVYGKRHSRVINQLTEIIVAHGASETITIACLSMIDQGDEVIAIDPAFDIYIPKITISGGIPKRISLDPPINNNSPWTLNFEKFESAFNTPNNPVGKVFTREELQKIAEILEKWPNVAIIADEVYEYLVFDEREHVSLCDFNNLWERTVTISSGGKIFSVTGWKTGWAIGGSELIKKMHTAKLWASGSSNTPCQGAIARALKIADCSFQGFDNYYNWLKQEYFNKREIMKRILNNCHIINIEPLLSEGGFFICGRIKNPQEFIPEKYLKNTSPDFAFCRWITETLKISAIPCSAFFAVENKHLGQDLVRFALCKDYLDYKKAEKILLNQE